MDYPLTLAFPHFSFGVMYQNGAVTAAGFLLKREAERIPTDRFAHEIARQVRAYRADGRFAFSLPLALTATPYQLKVCKGMQGIPAGSIKTYGALAAELDTAARPLGGACGRNPIPLIIPCHRVVSESGLGGFMAAAVGSDHQRVTLNVKRWLLEHEGAIGKGVGVQRAPRAAA